MKGFIRQGKNGDFYVDSYTRLGSLIIDEIILAQLIRFLRPYRNTLKRGRLLDLGSGTKPFENVYGGYFSFAVGLDMPSSVHGLSATDVMGSAMSLPFADESFDVVICTEVLEHLTDPWVAMRESARVLKPGGRLFLTTPFINPLHEVPHDFYRYTPFSLQFLGMNSGLSLDEVIEKGGLGAFLLLLAHYLCLNGLMRISQWSNLPLLSKWNPLLWLLFVWPQRLYLRLTKYWNKHPTSSLAPDEHGSGVFSRITLGYVASFSKPCAGNSERLTG